MVALTTVVMPTVTSIFLLPFLFMLELCWIAEYIFIFLWEISLKFCRILDLIVDRKKTLVEQRFRIWWCIGGSWADIFVEIVHAWKFIYSRQISESFWKYFFLLHYVAYLAMCKTQLHSPYRILFSYSTDSLWEYPPLHNDPETTLHSSYLEILLLIFFT